MKLDELVNKLRKDENVGTVVVSNNELGSSIVICEPSGESILTIPQKATNWLEVEKRYHNLNDIFSKRSREYIGAQIDEYLQTPIAERFPEPKFYVRFPGLNSSNGKQYLSTERQPLNGKFFMAAYNPNLIQKFTWKEIQTISNQPGFKGTFMQSAILSHAKKVNDNETD